MKRDTMYSTIVGCGRDVDLEIESPRPREGLILIQLGLRVYVLEKGKIYYVIDKGQKILADLF